MAVPRVFVSHSHSDNEWCREFVAALQSAGWDVWYDEKGLSAGAEWVSEIERQLQARDIFLLILTPASWASDWVRRELNLALVTQRQVVPVLHQETPGVSGFILALQWIKVVGLLATDAAHEALRQTPQATALPAQPSLTGPIPPLPPLRPAPVPSGVTELPAQKLNVNVDEGRAREVINRVREAQTIQPTPPVLPSDPFPSRLWYLGYKPGEEDGVAYLLPPLCNVPAGEFLMGSNKRRDREADSNETPQHRLMLSAFRIAKFPVTVAEYAYFVHAGHEPPEYWEDEVNKPDHPIDCVSWHEAVAYATWLATMTGQSWRLPTEAEWQKAARWDAARRVSRRYPWGNAFDQNRCNTREGGKSGTTPVGSYPNGASPCGAQDMAGNVWEWTSSLYKPYPYNASDGRERLDSEGARVLHGGSHFGPSSYARAACLNQYYPDSHHSGFRLALTPPGS